MSAKHSNKKNTRQKKLIHAMDLNKNEEKGMSFDLTSIEGREAAIVRQFNQIQRDYSRLMADVVKEFDLVKGWIGNQATSKTNELKSRLSARLSWN
jgi:hypothetical protein